MVVDRRGEAHLWLLLEEALVSVRRGVEVFEVRRSFRAVADALAAVGLVPVDVAAALAAELADALAVRGLVEVSSFTARPFPADAAAGGETAVPGGVAVWLETEIERHLDLLAGRPTPRPDAGVDALRVLGGPVRAFDAAGALGPARSLIDDFAASIASAGFDIGRHRRAAESGRVRREWVRFLRDAPSPITDPAPPTEVRTPRTPLGVLDDRDVRLDVVSWSDDVLDLEVAVRPRDGVGREDWTPWHARAIDDRGRLHLGWPGTALADGGSLARFRLRPGLPADARRLEVRVTTGGRRLEASVLL